LTYDELSMNETTGDGLCVDIYDVKFEWLDVRKINGFGRKKIEFAIKSCFQKTEWFPLFDVKFGC